MMTEHIYPLRTQVEDTDYGGIVYHANYLNFFERARSEWAEERGRGVEWMQAQNALLVVRFAKLDFLKPALLHQNLEVVSRIKEVRPASLVYDQYLRLAGRNDIILCNAEIKMACVDKQFRPRVLPDF